MGRKVTAVDETLVARRARKGPVFVGLGDGWLLLRRFGNGQRRGDGQFLGGFL
jgi:hypothetical protein